MDWRFFVSSFVFIAVTMAKLVFPEQTLGLRRQAAALIDMDMDYHDFIVSVGALLTDDPVQQVMGEVGELQEVVYEFVDFVDDSSTDNSSEYYLTVEEREVSAEVLQRVEAYHLSQEAYAEFETPACVSYDRLDIPFTYTSPVHAVCSSGFGYRVHPIEGQVMFHYGTDFDVVEGTEIRCFADGVVTAIGEEPGYGLYICVDHGDGWESLYAHCSLISVSSGQRVGKGEVLGKSGSTGRVTGPHLHFELTHQGYYTNPEFFLA